MRRLTLTLALLLLGLPAQAWQSFCYVYPDGVAPSFTHTGPQCGPGPESARQRWIGQGDEHRQLWNRARYLAGLPREFTDEDLRLRVYTSRRDVTVGTRTQTSLLPVPFERAERAQTRVWQVAEFTHLPDFSYSLWDWATGNETCPLADETASPEACHNYIDHLGPTNSSHFLPQAGLFYRHIHALAMTRARDCAALGDRLRAGGALDRFRDYVHDCELEAYTLEALAQHYLQDAFAMGHMWERWGGPELSDYGPPGGDRVQRAALVAAITGLIHGARDIVQALANEHLNSRFPGTTPLVDANDAMNFPHPGVRYLSFTDTAIVGPFRASGDAYVSMPLAPDPDFVAQHDLMFSCTTTGMLQVYRAAGHAEPLTVPVEGMRLRVIDPSVEGSECFRQRATDSAIAAGARIDAMITSPVFTGQLSVPLESFGLLLVAAADRIGSEIMRPVPLTMALQFSDDVARASAYARLRATLTPNDTGLASGGLPTMLGMRRNADYLRPAQPSTYADPALPWPATTSAAAPSLALPPRERAEALARVFHRAHAADWCGQLTDLELNFLRAHARDPSLDAPTRRAACEACGEFAVRHLRVGADAASYDTMAEPLCHFATPPGRPRAYLYQAPRGAASASSLAAQWCGCESEALVLTDRGLTRVALARGAVRPLGIAGSPTGFVAVGTNPRALGLTTRGGSRAVVTNTTDGNLSVVALDRDREREVDTDGNAMTTTTGAPAGVTRIAVGPFPTGMALSDDGRYALVAVSGNGNLAVVDLDTHRLCKSFFVGPSATENPYPEDVAIARGRNRVYVSLLGTIASPGRSLAVLDLARTLDCGRVGGEVLRHLEGFGATSRPGGLALSPDGRRLAVACRGNDRVGVVDTATDTLLDLRPMDPSRGMFLAARAPLALAWRQDGAQLFYGHLGGTSGSRLALNGTVRIGILADGNDYYDVGVQGAVRALLLGRDEDYVYVGDTLGNITALGVDLWDASPLHYSLSGDHTGGCINASRLTVPCAATANVGSLVRAMVEF
ncbi:MAG: YncE family protein [Deltaproteobacteria bacterium]|nr:YncE family protein [Deltaproteobacteria bacterium]